MMLIVLLMAACGATRKVAEAPEEGVTLSIEGQRRYEYYYLEAVRLEQQGCYDEAFGMLVHCLDICPEAPSALYKMATYYFFLNQKDKALDALLRAVKGEPDNYWYRQTLASYYQTNREYDNAIAVLEEMQQRFPKRNGELLSALVGLYSQTQQYDKVIDALSRLETLIGKTEAISMEKSRNYLLMGNQEGAFGEMEALAAEYPDNSYYRVVLASIYMENGREADALPVLQEILHEEPDNGAAKIAMVQYHKQVADTVGYHAMVDSVMMASTVDDDTKVKMMLQLINEKTDSTYVLQLFDRALQQPQRSAKLGHICVQYMLMLHQSEERVRPVLLRMLETEPDHVQAHLQLLSYAAKRNDLEEIIDICSKAIDYTPEVLDFYYYKAIGLYQTNRHEEALDTYRKATAQITQESNTELVSDIFTAMGDLYQQTGRLEEAYLCYDSALVYNPSNLLVLNNYAYFLSEEGKQLDKAELMSYRTIKAEPQNATYLDTYAWILYKQQRYEEALGYIEQALAADSVPSDVLYEHAGDIHYRLGDVQRALDYWKQALELQRKAEAVEERLKKKVKLRKLTE
ncbi:MAG: tetratricopeptide repeat protein [Bacteroidaceae bacterium]|nr:tetratricopeptide repeat protein [Bacteroidaceae bacterium]